MASSTPDRIHPTALISPEAELADDVRVGAFAIIEGPVRIGSGTIIHPRSHLMGPLTMGSNNQVFSNAILGGRPQHLHFKDEPTSLAIGDGNIFRENVTVHRATTQAWVTRIGSGNFFMAGSHIAHDCRVGDRCILANNALLGGHCEIEDNVYLSGNAGLHQFCRMGRLSFLSGVSASTKDVPPFIIQQNFNHVVGVNVIGMRRAGVPSDSINAIRRLYHLVYLQHRSVPNALAIAEAELGRFDEVREYIDFVRQSRRGVNGVSGPHRYQDLDLAA